MDESIATALGNLGGLGLFSIAIYRALTEGLKKIADALESQAMAMGRHESHLIKIETAVEHQLRLVAKMEERGYRLQRPTPPAPSQPRPYEGLGAPISDSHPTPHPGPWRGDTED